MSITYTFSNDTNSLYILSQDNLHSGNYTVTITATDGHPDTTPGEVSFNLEIIQTKGCLVYRENVANVSIAAHSNSVFTIENATNPLFTSPVNRPITR